MHSFYFSSLVLATYRVPGSTKMPSNRVDILGVVFGLKEDPALRTVALRTGGLAKPKARVVGLQKYIVTFIARQLGTFATQALPSSLPS